MFPQDQTQRKVLQQLLQSSCFFWQSVAQGCLPSEKEDEILLLQYSLELCCLFTLLMCAVDALGCVQGMSLALPLLFCTGHITSRHAYSQLTDPQSTLQWLFFEGKAIRFAPLTKLLAHRPRGKQLDDSSGPGRERTSKPRGWGLSESRAGWLGYCGVRASSGVLGQATSYHRPQGKEKTHPAASWIASANHRGALSKRL